jgi:integrase
MSNRTTPRPTVFPRWPMGRALRRAGLPPLRFHDLRHMAGTLMHEPGIPLKRAQGILGHASERHARDLYAQHAAHAR